MITVERNCLNILVCQFQATLLRYLYHSFFFVGMSILINRFLLVFLLTKGVLVFSSSTSQQKKEFGNESDNFVSLLDGNEPQQFIQLRYKAYKNYISTLESTVQVWFYCSFDVNVFHCEPVSNFLLFCSVECSQKITSESDFRCSEFHWQGLQVIHSCSTEHHSNSPYNCRFCFLVSVFTSFLMTWTNKRTVQFQVFLLLIISAFFHWWWRLFERRSYELCLYEPENAIHYVMQSRLWSQMFFLPLFRCSFLFWSVSFFLSPSLSLSLSIYICVWVVCRRRVDFSISYRLLPTKRKRIWRRKSK